MNDQVEESIKTVLGRVLAGFLSVEEAASEIAHAAAFETLLDRGEKRQWKRKDVQTEGTISIAYGLDWRRVSRPEKILVSNISAGGASIRTTFLSLDGLHIAGNLTEEVWMPNKLNLEVTLPTESPVKIRFQGSAEWFLKVRVERYYLVGVSIDAISMEHRNELLRFLF